MSKTNPPIAGRCGGCGQTMTYADSPRFFYLPTEVEQAGTPDWRPIAGAVETPWHTDCAEASGIDLHEC